jgi:hypothetical protein
MSSVPTRPRRTATLVAAIALTGAAAAGCGSSHTRNGAPVAAHSPAAAWHQVVLCARAHGMPNLPDPQIDASGKAIFPSGLNIPEQTRQGCQSLYDRLVPNAQDQPLTQAQLAALLRFARCMRSHGIADWPDPRKDGSFVPDARISQSLKSTFRSQLMTCEHFNPDPHGRVYFTHP